MKNEFGPLAFTGVCNMALALGCKFGGEKTEKVLNEWFNEINMSREIRFSGNAHNLAAFESLFQDLGHKTKLVRIGPKLGILIVFTNYQIA